MRASFVAAALAAFCLAPLVQAQVKVFGGPGNRHSSTLLAFTDSFEVKGGVSIQHGQPVWKDEYNDQAKFDAFLQKYKGKNVRLGKDWWTTFDNSVPVTIGGTRIPAGSWFLGLVYERDGSFQLAVIDSQKAMQNGEMPFIEAGWTVAFKAPMTLQRDAAQEVQKEMTIDLITKEGTPGKATLQIAWGRHLLTANVDIAFTGTADASGDKGKEAGAKKDAGEANKK